MDRKKVYRIFVRKGFELLVEQKGYLQIEIVNKMKTLGHILAPASFSKILSDKPIGLKVLSKAKLGIEELVLKELGYTYSELGKDFIKDQNTLTSDLTTIPEYKLGKPDQFKDLAFIPDGRLPIHEKVQFIQQASKEVIELGVRLNTFINYFRHRRSKEFRLPIQALLEQGVHFKLYLLDPTFNGTMLYFNDRAEALPEEKNSPERIKTVIREFKSLYKEYELNRFDGSFQLFTYKHIPYNHFLITDPQTSTGRMIVSHYLYGVKRADAPVIQFSKRADYDLFSRYMKSFRAIINQARPVDLDT